MKQNGHRRKVSLMRAHDPDDLTPKERRFIAAYLGNGFNGLRAAAEAGLGHTRGSQSVAAARVLEKPNARAVIQASLRVHMMSGNETLVRLSEIARADMGDFLTDEGRLKRGAIPKRGRLVKSARRSEDGSVELTLHDAQRALETIAKHHGLLKETVELGGAGGPVELVVNLTKEEWDAL